MGRLFICRGSCRPPLIPHLYDKKSLHEDTTVLLGDRKFRIISTVTFQPPNKAPYRHGATHEATQIVKRRLISNVYPTLPSLSSLININININR